MHPLGSFTASAADQHSPSHEEHRRRQASQPGPRSSSLIVFFLVLDIVVIGAGVAMRQLAQTDLERIGGLIVIIAGSFLFLAGIVHLVLRWLWGEAALPNTEQSIERNAIDARQTPMDQDRERAWPDADLNRSAEE